MKSGFFRNASLGTISAVLALSVSCASRISPKTDIAAETLFSESSFAYARMDSVFLEGALPFLAAETVDKKKFLQGAKSFLDRTDTMYLALSPPLSGSKKNILYALGRGTYPDSAVSAALFLDKSWEKRGKEWVLKPGSLFLSGIDRNTLLLGTAPLEKFSAAVNAAVYPPAKTGVSAPQTRNPIPEIWRDAWNSPFSFFILKPAQNLASALPLEDAELPLLSLFISGTGPGKRGYAMYMSFEFDSAPGALMFSPLCKLMLYGAAHRLWPEKAATILDDAIWRIDSRYVSVSGFFLDAADITAFAGLLQ